MLVSIIVAVSENNVIGIAGQLPWRLSADLQLFKQKTSGHTVLMGRKTFESIGKALPNRQNIIITRQADFRVANCEVVDSLAKGLALAKELEKEEIFVIGGGEIYRQSIALVDKIYLSQVKTSLEGDTFFPEIQWEAWEILQKKQYPIDEKNNFAFEWFELQRKIS